MGDTAASKDQSVQGSLPSKRIKSVSTICIISCALSAVGVLLTGWLAFGVGSIIPSILADPQLGAAQDDSAGQFIAELGFGSLTETQALAAVFALVALFSGFGAVVSLVSLAASVGIIRSVKRPASRYRCFALGLIGGIASIVTMRVASGALLIVASVKIRNQQVEDEGGKKAFYADGKRLGFMRFVQFACIAEIIMNVTLLLFVMRSDSYDGAWWINFVMLIMMAVTYWTIWNRRQHGCAIICCMVAACLAINVVYYVAIGRFDAFAFAENSVWPVVMLLYFCIFSVVGHWMEWSVCWLIRWGIVPGTYDPNSGIWRDMLNPFFVYGIAFVFIGLLLFPIKNRLLKAFKGKVVPSLLASFAVNTLVCAAIELATGLVLNTPPDP